MKFKDFKPVHLEMIKNENEKEWKSAIREEINHYKAAHQSAAKKHGLSADYELEFSGAMEKRRIKALTDSLPEIQEKHPDLVRDWIILNSVSQSYAFLEDNHNLLLAAAIWILDQLDKADLCSDELYKLLPTDENDIEFWTYPDIWDCRFEDTLIYSVEYVLKNRNKDVAPPENDGNDGIRVWTSILAANGVVHSDAKSRQNYEKLIGLIPQDRVYVAVQHFKQYFNSWKERYFACVEPLYNKAEKACNKVNEIRRRINEAESKAAEIVNKTEKERRKISSKKKPPMMAPFAAPINNFPMNMVPSGNGPLNNPLADMLSDDVVPLLSELDELSDKDVEAVDAYNSAMGKKFTFSATLNRRGCIPKAACEEEFGIEASLKMDMLHISDPYELCFALLYLLEQGSDIPWLYGPCIGLMEEVVYCLPWGYYCYEEDRDDIWNNEAPAVKKPVSFPDWYDRCYYQNTDEELNYPHNLAQIIYEETGCLMPRDLHKYDSKHKYLNKFGIQRNNAVALLYCMDIMGSKKAEKKPAAKKAAAPAKKAEAKTAAPEAAEVKAPAKAEPNKETKKPAAKKAAPAKKDAAKTAPAKKETKKAAAPAKKAAAKKAAPAKPAKIVTTSVLQAAGNEFDFDKVVKAVEGLKKKNAGKNLEIYIKPEDRAIYYVVNGKGGKKIDL